MNANNKGLNDVKRELFKRAKEDRRLLIEAAYLAATVISVELRCSLEEAFLKIVGMLDDEARKNINAESEQTSGKAPMPARSAAPISGVRPHYRSVDGVVRQVKQLIASGSDDRFKPGERIPSGRSMVGEFGSLMTVQRALRELVASGVLVPVRSGLVVPSRPVLASARPIDPA